MPERDWQKDWEMVQEARDGNWWRAEYAGKMLDALPYWLQRVRELEQLVCDFQAAALLGTDPDGITPEMIEREITILRLQLQRLEAENRRLRAVAEAARSYLKNCVGNECDDEGMYDLCEVTCPLEDLREALAALKEAKD